MPIIGDVPLVSYQSQAWRIYVIIDCPRKFNCRFPNNWIFKSELIDIQLNRNIRSINYYYCWLPNQKRKFSSIHCPDSGSTKKWLLEWRSVAVYFPSLTSPSIRLMCWNGTIVPIAEKEKKSKRQQREGKLRIKRRNNGIVYVANDDVEERKEK